jgi:putative membrane protein
MFYKIVITLILNAGLLYGLADRINGISYTGGITFLIVGTILISTINTIVKPIIKLLTLPFILLSGGMMLVVINAVILWFFTYFLEIAQFRDVTFTIESLGSLLIAAIIFGIFNTITSVIK